MGAKVWILLDNLTKIQSQPISSDELQSAISRLPTHEFTRYFLWTSGWQNWQPLNEYLESDQKTLSVAVHSPTEVKSSKQQSSTPTQHNSALISQEKTLTQTKLDFASDSQDTVHVEKSMTDATLSDYSKHNHIKQPVHNDYDSELISTKAPTVNHINFKNINDPYRNRSERHEFKIEIILISKKNKTFRSFSKNISLTGSLLEEVIPIDFHDDQFDLVVVNRNPTNTLNSRVQLRAEVIKNEGLTQRLTFINVSQVQKQRLKDLLNDYITQQKKLKSA